MPRLRLSPSNIYLKSGLVLLGGALACGVLLFVLWPAHGGAGMALSWGLKFGLLGGLVLYVIGRIVGARRHGPQG